MPDKNDSEKDKQTDDALPAPEVTAKPSSAEGEETDQAVDDIMKHEGDEVLRAQEAADFAPPEQPWYKKIFAKKKIWIPLAIVLAVALLAAVPFTRYRVLGLFWQQTYAVRLVDSQTGKPVSSATITLADKRAETDNQGRASIKTKVGSAKLSISKKYYATTNQTVLVGLKSHPVRTFKLQATGRQVPLMVLNKVSGAPVSNAEIAAAGTKVKTDKNGKVTMVLPANKAKVEATVTALEFNALPVTIQITTATNPANTFRITPAGKAYFLSNASGKIDVVSTNLDGTDRQTVLAGSGHEDADNTVLLASRNWKHLALLSKRDTSGKAQLNLIETENNQLINIDKGDASFALVGWSGDLFAYVATRNNIPNWQPKKEALKSFNATTKKLTTIDETEGQGANADDYAKTSFSTVYSLNNELVYTKSWTAETPFGRTPTWLSGKQASVISVKPDGSAKTTVKDFPVPESYATNYYSYYSLDLAPYEPQELYLKVPSSYDKSTYYEYENRAIRQRDDITEQIFNKAYPTYLLSPSGSQTFWSEERDGKNTLFVGTAAGDNKKQVASLSEYQIYGWYTDNYFLVTKEGSELYIMPSTGGTPFKISDYYKPTQTFRGYGGGYGGL